MRNAPGTLSPFSNPLIRFMIDGRYRWLRHVLFILVGLILAFKGDVGDQNKTLSQQARHALLWVDSLSFLFIMGMLYLLLYVLIPKLLFRSRIFLFLLSFLGIIALIYIVAWLLDLYLLRPQDPQGTGMPHIELSWIYFIQIGAVCAVLLAAVTGLMVFKKWIKDVEQLQELREMNLKTELEQLKSQVNPHFLFNTLNNLHVLTRVDLERASQVILGLSDLLRYQLYDSSQEHILLSKDIAFMHNLLSLEKLRKEDFEYAIKVEGKTDGISLPPFLFIPFVENAIKHGASATGHSYVKFDFRITGEQVYFCSENSIPATRRNLPGGLGLNNIRRRLQLLYPDRHQLTIKDQDNKYIVTLILPL